MICCDLCYFCHMSDVYTPPKNMLFEIISMIENGENLKNACAAHNIKPQLFNHHLRSNKEAAISYARALELRADLLADEIIEIADTATDAAKARNQIETRKWVASKHNSKKYGDRIDLNVSMAIDISATLNEAQARLLPMRDLENIIDAQVIDNSISLTDPSTDTLSVGQEIKPQQPAIFDD